MSGPRIIDSLKQETAVVPPQAAAALKGAVRTPVPAVEDGDGTIFIAIPSFRGSFKY
jgi:hypothetical protein